MGDSSAHFYIDLFAGCGGLSLGLHKAGWNGLFAIESSPMAFLTLKHNLMDRKKHFKWPDWLPVGSHDINEVLRKHDGTLRRLNGKVDLVVGGPPCQGFSSAGRRDESDKRNKLAGAYVNFIRRVRPRLLLFENVKGFTQSFGGKCASKPYSSRVTTALEKLGYCITSQLVNFSEFGVPQRRERFILVGSLADTDGFFFKELKSRKHQFLRDKGLNDDATLRQAISDLERRHGERDSYGSKHFKEGIYGPVSSKYQIVMKNEANKEFPDSHRFARHTPEVTKRFKMMLVKYPRDRNIGKKVSNDFGTRKQSTTILSGKSQSPTLTTLPDDYIHYSEPRILTVREYARIQSFDDWFEFMGKYTTGGKLRKKETPRYSQVGNAVPPLFAEQAGNVLKEMN